jgi:phosphotransferase system enzyme I (PtsP)
MSDAQELLQHVLKMDNPLMVKSWLEYYFRTHGLGDMVKSASRMVSA